jgi:hypothetical protein
LREQKVDSIRYKAKLKLDEATLERDKILSDRGEYLSKRLKTTWYQEGERSTKYFLNLLKGKSRKIEIKGLCDGNEITNSKSRINEIIESFYKRLYENGDTNRDSVPNSKLIGLPKVLPCPEPVRNKFNACPNYNTGTENDPRLMFRLCSGSGWYSIFNY